MPVKDQLGETLLDHDECIRTGTTVDDLAKLKPSFVDMGANFGFDSIAIQRYPEVERIEHVHHAGNSSVIVDGAASVLVGTKEVGQELGLKPKAKIVGFASTGSEPTIMLTGPAPSARKVLKRCGMSKDDIDLFELNEAFAAVVLKYMKEMDIAHEQINVNGGAIAMGHPLGATGAMVLGTLIDELERRDLNTGLVNLCIGGGMGTSTIVERV
jgi:acetyl-CoA C-acetyltransferase